MLADTGDTKSSILSPDTDDEHVEWDLSLHGVSLDVGIVLGIDNLLLIVNLGAGSFVELDRGLLVSQDISNGFHDGSMFDGAGCTRGKQRGEEEEVSRRDDDDIVILGVEVFQKRHGAPASTC